MDRIRSRAVVAIARASGFTCCALVLLLAPAAAAAQSLDAVEVTAFGGYRFGGGFYEIASGRPVDVDGAGSFGLAVNIPFHSDMQIEALVTHQEARFTLPAEDDPAGTRWRVAVDHYQVGGLSEFGAGRARPFLTGTLGLTRYAADGDNEVRFSLAAGGGVKLYPTPHLGLRLDGRLYGTIVDADVDALFCAPGRCIGTIDAWMVWQAEFTAGLMVRF
jgi:opacity protein-like surface antigen